MLAFSCIAVVKNDKHITGGSAVKGEKPFKAYIEYFPAVSALSVFRADKPVPPRFVREVDAATGEARAIDGTPAVRKARRDALVLQLHASDVLNIKAGVRANATAAMSGGAASVGNFASSEAMRGSTAVFSATAFGSNAPTALTDTPMLEAMAIVYKPRKSRSPRISTMELSLDAAHEAMLAAAAQTHVGNASLGSVSMAPTVNEAAQAGRAQPLPPASQRNGGNGGVVPTSAHLGRFAAHLRAAAFPFGPLHFTALISPVSGKGEGLKQWLAIAKPLLDASPHQHSVIMTTHRGHAEDYAASAELRPNEVLVAVGGDGMAHEVVNGFDIRRKGNGTAAVTPSLNGKRDTGDFVEARSKDERVLDRPGPAAGAKASSEKVNEAMPRVALYPTGSGCALAKVLGVIEPLDAAMAMIHASYMPMDLMDLHYSPVTRLAPPKMKGGQRVEEPAEAVTQPDRVAFLSVNLAFGASVDIESEVHRWMGNARFTFYAVKKIIGEVPTYPLTIRYKPAVARHIVNMGHGRRDAEGNATTSIVSGSGDASGATPLSTVEAIKAHCQPFTLQHDMMIGQQQREQQQQQPQQRAGANTEDGWITLEQTEFVFVILCNIPWIARDMFTAPYSHMNDGCMDLVYAAPGLDRVDLVKALVEMEEGKHIAHPKMRYIKCVEVELIPRDGYISVDGERMPLSAIRGKVSDMRLNIVHLAAPPPIADMEAAVVAAGSSVPL
jgi:diacylglycerol kinase family enzyme